MNVFDGYAHYYDLLYKDKDYASESEYIKLILKRLKPDIKNLLELGCGSGKHALNFVKSNYEICGIDKSDKMLAYSEKVLSKLPKKIRNNINLIQGDIRSIRLNKKFDAVVSLFHVLSYQISNDDLLSTFFTAKEHLKPNGIFIFDCWYGPGVLTELPSSRVKIFENEEVKIVRMAEPDLFPNKNKVDVNYYITVLNKINMTYEELSETHSMRYFFYPEIEFMLSQAGFRLIHAYDWMKYQSPSTNSWNVVFVAKVV